MGTKREIEVRPGQVLLVLDVSDARLLQEIMESDREPSRVASYSERGRLVRIIQDAR